MLHEFYVDNYKSLINVTFTPREMSILLGINNAGKTNLCQAIRFVAATATMSLDECADAISGVRIGIANHHFDKNTVDFGVKATVRFQSEELDFDYRLGIRVPTPSSSSPPLEVESETLTVRGAGFRDVCLLENTRKGVRLLHEVEYLAGNSRYAETTAPRDKTMLNRLYDLSTNPRANCFKRYLQTWCYYALSPEAMRGSQHNPRWLTLMPDGSNLGSTIYHMKTSFERHYRRVLERLKTIDPSIDVINFFAPSEANVFMVFEDSQGNRLPAHAASSGTLRYLALLYVLLVQPSSMHGQLVIVEEPENGMYVGYLKDLLNAAANAEGRPQFVFTSHGPYFLDLFDNRLDSVFLVKRGDQHSTVTQPDVNRLKSQLADFSLGEQHFQEILE